MRIIAGSARGRTLLAPKGLDTRPTLDRVKESLFSILQFSLPGARILDLYAGSGNLALEALSRGAAYALCNDSDAGCCEIIRRNLQTLGFQHQAEVWQMDARAAIHRLAGSPGFDILFLDPPYRENVTPIMDMLFAEGLVAANGCIVVEHAWSSPPVGPATAPPLRVDRRKYGATGLSFFERELLS